MAIYDRFSKRFDKKREKQARDNPVVDPDAPPLPVDPVEQIKADEAPGRNDPCPCGSGKKYKKCCGKPS